MQLQYRTYSPQKRLLSTELKSLSLEARGLLEILRDYCWTEGSIWADLNRWRSCYGVSPQTARRLFPEIQSLFSLSGDTYLCLEVQVEKDRINTPRTALKVRQNSEKSQENSGKTPVKLRETPVKLPQNSEFLNVSPIIAPTEADISKVIVKESKVIVSNTTVMGGVSSEREKPPPPTFLQQKNHIPINQQTRELDDCVNLIAAEFKVPLVGNEKKYDSAAITLLNHFPLAEVAQRLEEFRRSKPSTKLGFLAEDFATWAYSRSHAPPAQAGTHEEQMAVIKAAFFAKHSAANQAQGVNK